MEHQEGQGSLPLYVAERWGVGVGAGRGHAPRAESPESPSALRCPQSWTWLWNSQAHPPSPPASHPLAPSPVGEHSGAFRRFELYQRDHAPVHLGTVSPATEAPTALGPPHPCPEERDPVPNVCSPQPRPCGLEEYRLGSHCLSAAIGLQGAGGGPWAPRGEQPGWNGLMGHRGSGLCPG